MHLGKIKEKSQYITVNSNNTVRNCMYIYSKIPYSVKRVSLLLINSSLLAKLLPVYYCQFTVKSFTVYSNTNSDGYFDTHKK